VANAKIIVGDVRTSLARIETGTIQTCITSPPYWGLRDYGNDGQIGLEQSPEEYVAQMVKVFREVKRVLRDDGTLWLNIGDSYSSFRDSKVIPDSLRTGDGTKVDIANNRNPTILKASGIKHKDLVGIPWMVAFALRADGWYLRQDIIWAKPNPMPESVSDRCTKSHEYLFLLTKSPKYYYDNEAIKELAVTPIDTKSAQSFKAVGGKARQNYGTNEDNWVTDGMRNKRDVWTITTKPFKGAHFAVMPEALVEPCLLAGTSAGGHCVKCGTGYIRSFEKGEIKERKSRENRIGVIPGRDSATRMQSVDMEAIPKTLTGWEKQCECGTDETRPALVLDPFTGSGTVGVVALNHGRDFVGTELNPEYAIIAENRISDSNPMFDTVTRE
jgi:DNA modification methylase